MTILFHVATEHGGRVLLPLALACKRGGHAFAVFMTHDGVRGLGDPVLCSALAAARRAVACEESWRHFGGGHACPIELGSQTDNSALTGEALRVVSL